MIGELLFTLFFVSVMVVFVLFGCTYEKSDR